MGSFGGVLKGFTRGFETGHRMALANREMNLREYQHGKPPKGEVEAIPPIGEGAGTVPVIGGDEAKPGVDPTTTGSVSSAPMPNAGGKSIGDQMYGYYRSKGLSHAAAAGIAGNLMQESGGDPRVIGGHRRGDGGASGFAAQWNGSRLTNLYKFAGTQTPTLQQQLDFVLEEMNPNSPYADKQAAAASQSILGARTVEEATQLFRDEFERPLDPADIKPRLNYAAQFADSGDSSEPFSFGPGGGEPASAEPEKEDDSYDTASSSGGEEEDSGFEPVESVPLPDVPSVELTSWDQFAKPLWQDPTLYAADGGVLPEPDKFNKDRAFTQLNPTTASGAPSSGGFSASSARRVGGGGSWAPRAVGQRDTWKGLGAGLTPSQQRFRDLRAVKPVAAAPAAAPVAAKQPFQVTPAVKKLAQLKGQTASSTGHQLRINREIAHWQGIVDQERAARGYAGGGKVDRLKAGTRRERTISSRGEEAGQTARDRAARRINVGTSGRSSTAISADGYWKKGGKGRKKDTPTRRAKKTKPRSETKPVPTPTPRPKTEFSPDLAVSPNRPDNRPATNAPTNNPPTVPQPRPGRLSDEYSPNPPPIYEPGGGAMPAVRQPLPGRLSDENAGVLPFEPGDTGRGMVPTPPQPRPGRLSQEYATPSPSQPRGRTGNAMTMPDAPGRPVIGGQPRPASPASPARPTAPTPTMPSRTGPIPAPQGVPGNPLVGSGGPAGTGAIAGSGSGISDLGGGNALTIGDLVQQLLGMDPNTPLNTNSRSGQPMFAQGGVIPDDPLVSQRALDANYQTPRSRRRPLAPSASAEGAAGPEGPEEEPDIEPTPRLLADVGQAISGGLQFLKRTFSSGGDGGVMPSPEGDRQRQNGAARMASGEGRADQQEVQEVYARVDPDNRMSEGQKYMTSLAQTMQWYLANGRKDDAEGAAASLMLYGADRFGKYGAMAGAAYSKYQQTGDRDALEDTVGYLEKAYQMIPDGGDFDIISLDEESGQLVTVHRDANGNEQQFDISPDQLPILLQQVQNSSGYWSQVAALADPEGTRQRERHRFEAGQARQKRGETLADRDDTRRYETYKTGETRRYNEGQKAAERAQEVQDRKDERELKELDAKTARGIVLSDREEARRLQLEDAAAARKLVVSDRDEERRLKLEDDQTKRTQVLDDEKRERAQQLEDKILAETWLRSRPVKRTTTGAPEDEAAVNALLQDYLASAGKGKESQGETDNIGTELLNTVLKNGGTMKWLNEQGIWPGSDFTYLGGPEGEGGETPPEGSPEGTQRMLDNKGQPIWAYPDPSAPGGWTQVD